MRLKLAVVAVLAFGGVAHAGVTENPASVSRAIATALPGEHITVLPNGGGMMPACHSPLAISWIGSPDAMPRTADVSCHTPVWTIYAQVLVRKLVAVLVARSDIPVGGLIDAGNTMRKPVSINKIEGTALQASQIGAGLVTTQPVKAGVPILTSMVNIPPAVRNGEGVTITVIADGVQISASGVALETGPVGASIEVENASSHSRLLARVVRDVPSKAGVYIVERNNPG